jgi:hypothetical protein
MLYNEKLMFLFGIKKFIFCMISGLSPVIINMMATRNLHGR